MTCHDMSYRIKNTYKKGPICMSYGKVGVLYDVTYRKYRPPVHPVSIAPANIDEAQQTVIDGKKFKVRTMHITVVID